MKTTSVLDEIVYHDEGITVTHSDDGLIIKLPRPSTGQQQLGVIAVLWEICLSAAAEPEDDNPIHIEVEDEVSLPLMVTITAITTELERVNRRLYVRQTPTTDQHLAELAN
jgi:hypothetical protein